MHGRALFERAAQLYGQCGAVLAAGLRRREPRIDGQVVTLQGTAQGAELFRSVGRQVYPIVGGLIKAVKSAEAVLSLVRETTLRASGVPDEVLRVDEDAGVQEIDIDSLRNSRALPDDERHDCAERGQRARNVVRRRHLPEVYRPVLRPALGPLKADERLGQRIEAGPMGVGPGPAEGGHVRLDYPG